MEWQINWEKLRALEQRLRDISEARRLNAELREGLKRRLAVVECEIHTQEAKSESPFLYYEEKPVWGVSCEEAQKLVQLFWGKNRTETTREVEKGEKRAEKITKRAQRLCFVNGERSARQRCLALQTIDPAVRVKSMFLRPNVCAVDQKFVIDTARFVVMNAVFGRSVQLRRVYPWINAPKMIAWTQQAVKGEVRALAELGVDAEKLQQRIKAILEEAEQNA